MNKLEEKTKTTSTANSGFKNKPKPQNLPICLSPIKQFQKRYCQDCTNKRGKPCRNEAKCIQLTLANAINNLPTGLATELHELEIQKRYLQ